MNADVLIVGAGPAGSSAAIALAGLGYRVLIADRARFPRPHIGESLPPKIDRLLDILGVKAELERAAFLRMRGTTIYQDGRATTHDFDPDPRVLGYQVDRARFDGLLLDRARALGATVLEETLISDPRAFAATRFVIDASGQRSTLAKLFGARRREAIRTVAITGYYRGARTPENFPAENTLFEMRPDGWLWSVLLSDGRRNITVGLDPELLRARKTEEVYHSFVAASELLSGLIQGCVLDGELTGHDATWYSSDRYAGEDFLLAGDSASFIDPLTSHGVYKAMHSGITAAAVINTVIRRPENAAAAIAYYEAHQQRTHEKYAEIALTFYRASPFADAPFWRLRTRPEATAAPVTLNRVEEFRARVRQPDAATLPIRAVGSVRVELRAVAEAYFIVEKSILVVGEGDASEELASAEPSFDPAAFLSLLDGRPLERVFEGYVEKTGRPRNKGVAQMLITMLAKLAEHGVLEFR